MFSIGNTILLSNGAKYIVTGTALIKNKTYYNLVDATDLRTITYCVEKKEGDKIYFKEFTDKEVIVKLLPYFKKSVEDFLKNNPNA